MAHVLVTGAGGFLGAHVCPRLRQHGFSVHALLRTGTPPDGIPHTRVDDYTNAAARAALDAADCVVHLAGRAHVLREQSGEAAGRAFQEANVNVTRALVQMAAKSRVRTFILMSSVAAGTNRSSESVADGADCEPDSAYGRSKRDAEEALADVAAASGMRWVALRPPMVYGEGMRGNPLRLYAHIARGRPVPVAWPPPRRSMIYVGNLSDAVIRAIRADHAEGVFFVADAQPLTVERFITLSAYALGRNPRLLRIPRAVLASAALFMNAAARLSGVEQAVSPLSGLMQTLIVDGSRFADLVGHRPSIGPEEAIRRTAVWFRTSFSNVAA